MRAYPGQLDHRVGANAAHVVAGVSGDDTISSGTTLASTDTVDVVMEPMFKTSCWNCY